MNRADDLKRLTREVLGSGTTPGFLARIDEALEKNEGSTVNLSASTRKIEHMVKLFIGEEPATRLGLRYKEYFRKNPSYI